MVVTLRATDCESEPHGPERVCAVDYGLDPKLLGIGSTFAVCKGVALKSGSHVSTGNHVSRDLLDGEAIEWHIPVQCIDYPIPPPPGIRAKCIPPVAVAISVARL